MNRLTEAQRMHLFAIRKAMKRVASEVSTSNETEFNSKASFINDVAVVFDVWKKDKDYVRGSIVIDPDDGIPYWAMHNNGITTGQVHQPSKSPTIWTHCHGTTPETARPFIAEGHNPYMKGHYCLENGIAKRCNSDNIVHPPSVLPNMWD